MKITFPDGSIKEYEKGVSSYEIAKSISNSLAKNSIFAYFDSIPYDLNRPLLSDGSLELVTKDNEASIEVLNHSCAHLMASAIKNLYPKANFGVGPTIEEGFYYDVQLNEDINLTEEDLVKIEKEMKRIANQNLEFIRSEVSKDEAIKQFSDDKYKVEIINDLPKDEIISVYTHGDFADLCRGPHLPNTSFLKHFKLLNVSGAYWRGDSKNEQLQRIYGICFFKNQDLEDYLNLVEERQARDHRRLGRELDLFMISEYGPGFPFWLPNGMILRKTLEDFWLKIHTKEGYKFISTPIMLNKELWEISGHWENYRENMYISEIDKHQFAIKPMNCPGGLLVYKHYLHSYRDFPLRVGELGLVHRHEASGALNGLFRVRNFTQDDAHLFMTEDMIVEEVGKLIQLFDKVYEMFDLPYTIELSTRPEDNYIGTKEVWDRSEKALADACRAVGKDFKINEGDGAFYGPKLDFKLRDSMNRIWQCGTIQLDANLPERFDITYIDQDGQKKRPVMLHRALFGSLERFIGILIEHFGGAFPTWLAPVQVKLIPVNLNHHTEHVKKLQDKLMDLNIRAEMDLREEKLGYKIRETQIKKIPYQIVIGDKEIEDNLVTVRRYGKEKTKTIPLDEFIRKIQEEISTFSLEKLV